MASVGSGWLQLASLGFSWLWWAAVGLGWLELALVGFGWVRLALVGFGWLWLALIGRGGLQTKICQNSNFLWSTVVLDSTHGVHGRFRRREFKDAIYGWDAWTELADGICQWSVGRSSVGSPSVLPSVRPSVPLFKDFVLVVRVAASLY